MKAGLVGCDTLVALPPTTPSGTVVFGKNSDRPSNERQVAEYHAATFGNADESMVQCTYVKIPQIANTHAVWLVRPDWMWGAEMGINERNVVIGNEAVWTKLLHEAGGELLGMDLVRLGLERGGTAADALSVMTDLLETHGQGGACKQDDPSWTYHNSFLIADAQDAWILETAGRHWVAKKHRSGGCIISNQLTLRTEFDRYSAGLHEYCRQNRLWDGHSQLDWAKIMSADEEDIDDPGSRWSCGRQLLARHANTGKYGVADMQRILRDHDSGLCMHGPPFTTTASMVVQLSQDAPEIWLMDTPMPCQHEYTKVSFRQPF